VVGDLTLSWKSLHLPNDPDQRILVYAAEPGSRSEQALNVLGSWTSTPIQMSATDSADHR